MASDPGGRPTKFCESIVRRLLFLIGVKGRTDEIACAMVGIAPGTFYRWQKENPAFREMVKDAKEIIDDQVESTVLMLASGFKLPDLKIHYDSEAGEFREHVFERVVPPSEGAAKLWLMNRRRHEWRETMRHEVQKPVDAPIAMAYDPARRISVRQKQLPQNTVVDVTAKNSGREDDVSEDEV